MPSTNLRFPCLCLHQKLIFTVDGHRDLLGVTINATKNDLVRELKIIDSDGREFGVDPPKKPHPLAAFWAKLTRKRQKPVPPSLIDTGRTWSVHQIRQMLLIDSQRQGPLNKVRAKEFKERIDAARTPAEILELLARQSSNTSLREW